MDDFINPFISSSTWQDANPSARSSWDGAVVSQTNSLLADSIEAYGGNEKIPQARVIPSGHIMGNAAVDDLDLHRRDGGSCIFANGTLGNGVDKDLFPGEKLSQQMSNGQNPQLSLQDDETHVNFSLQGVVESNLPTGSFDLEMNTACSVPLPQCALAMSSSLESDGSELSTFQHSLGDSNSISSVPTMWTSSYSSVSSFLGQEKLTTFGLQGVENSDVLLRKAYADNGNFPQLDDISTTSLQDHNALQKSNLTSFAAGNQIDLTSGALLPCQHNSLHNLHLPSLASGPQMTFSKTAEIQARQQLSPSSEENAGKQHVNHSSSQVQPASANAGGCNGAAKPRVRARRGQATDPHSIAERLRREKIAERMKNLQELVPNANKTDKASMLDEIIDYVKFLQLQVKVLSMSRLGAAGAVVPLLTDAQAEGSGSLLLSSSVAQSGADLSESQDSLAFEQEVVKLMESSVTTAMQYLQNKGLCLMPIALASAISNQKGSSTAIPPDNSKHVGHGLFPQSGHSFMERNGVEDGANGCNSVKQEEAQKPTANSRELKPEA